MQTILMQIVPETTGNNMPQRIGEIMSHHLGITRRARSKIHQRNIIVAIDMSRTDKGGRLSDALLEIIKALRHQRSYRDHLLHTRRLGQCILHMLQNHLLARTDNHLDRSSIRPINDVFLRQQMGRRNHHRT